MVGAGEGEHLHPTPSAGGVFLSWAALGVYRLTVALVSPVPLLGLGLQVGNRLYGLTFPDTSGQPLQAHPKLHPSRALALGAVGAGLASLTVGETLPASPSQVYLYHV